MAARLGELITEKKLPTPQSQNLDPQLSAPTLCRVHAVPPPIPEALDPDSCWGKGHPYLQRTHIDTYLAVLCSFILLQNNVSVHKQEALV